MGKNTDTQPTDSGETKRQFECTACGFHEVELQIGRLSRCTGCGQKVAPGASQRYVRVVNGVEREVERP